MNFALYLEQCWIKQVKWNSGFAFFAYKIAVGNVKSPRLLDKFFSVIYADPFCATYFRIGNLFIRWRYPDFLTA